MNLTSKPPLLIVDDDPDDRQIIKDAFLENKHSKNYVLMESGDQLMQYLHSVYDSPYPCLIMLDLNMPGKDGREALKEIKTNSKFQHIPTIVFTTSSQEKDREISYRLGANCFLTKPSSYNQMVEITDSIAKLWCPDSN